MTKQELEALCDAHVKYDYFARKLNDYLWIGWDREYAITHALADFRNCRKRTIRTPKKGIHTHLKDMRQ